jgi:preprotein translocase subunit YajC
MEQSSFISLFPLAILFVLFYFILIKPQQKKAQQQRKMLEEMKIGDMLVLTSGIICEVADIPDEKEYIFVKLNNDTIIRIFKDVIVEKYEEKNKQQLKK